MTHQFFEPFKCFVSAGELVHGLQRAFRTKKTTHDAIVNGGNVPLKNQTFLSPPSSSRRKVYEHSLRKYSTEPLLSSVLQSSHQQSIDVTGPFCSVAAEIVAHLHQKNIL